MKKYIFALITMLLSVSTVGAQNVNSIQDNSVYVLDTVAQKGEQVILSFHMKNSAEVQAIGMVFELPQGFSVAKNDRGRFLVALNGNRNDEHSIGMSLVDGIYKVAITNNNGYSFIGNEGEIFSVTLDVEESIAEGDYEVKLSQVELSGKNGKISEKGEYVGKITISPVPALDNVNIIKKEEVTIYDVNGIVRHKLMPGLNIIKNMTTGDAKTIFIR